MTQRPARPEGSSSARSTTHSTTETGDLRQALLTSLGLPGDATPEAIDAAHDRVASYLTAAPTELSGWARQQAAAADAAHAVLTGKAGDVLSRRSAPAVAARRGSSLPTPLLLVAGLALVVAIVLAVGKWGPGAQTAQTKPAVAMGDQSTTGSDQQSAAATPTPLDPAKAKELEAKVAKNPQDVQSLAQLGDLYFGAEDYAKAAAVRDKIVAVRPTDTDALLAAGVAWFNGQDSAKAQQRWEKAVELDPKKAEAYYDLGFLHLSKTPPDTAKAKQMWDKVVELNPNGPLAQKVQNHMGALITPAPTAPASAPSTSSK